jgi:hypothetical protein
MKPTMTNNFLAGATYVEGVVAGSKAQGNPPTFEEIGEVCARTGRTFRNNQY